MYKDAERTFPTVNCLILTLHFFILLTSCLYNIGVNVKWFNVLLNTEAVRNLLLSTLDLHFLFNRYLTHLLSVQNTKLDKVNERLTLLLAKKGAVSGPTCMLYVNIIFRAPVTQS